MTIGRVSRPSISFSSEEMTAGTVSSSIGVGSALSASTSTSNPG